MYNGRIEKFANEELVIHYSDSELALINRSLNGLIECLKKYLHDEIEDVLIYGSETRGTMLPRAYDNNSDVDILVEFKQESSHLAPDTLRNHIRTALENRYPRSEVYQDYPSISLELQHLKFDINPAIRVPYNSDYYQILCRGEWIITNPNELTDLVESTNKSIGGNLLRRVLRLCKYWNKSYGKGAMTSYDLEKFVCMNLPTVAYSGRTYDAFLDMVEILASYRIEYQGSPALNMVRTIKEAKRSSDWWGQKWRLERLLPGIKLD